MFKKASNFLLHTPMHFSRPACFYRMKVNPGPPQDAKKKKKRRRNQNQQKSHPPVASKTTRHMMTRVTTQRAELMRSLELLGGAGLVAVGRTIQAGEGHYACEVVPGLVIPLEAPGSIRLRRRSAWVPIRLHLSLGGELHGCILGPFAARPGTCGEVWDYIHVETRAARHRNVVVHARDADITIVGVGMWVGRLVPETQPAPVQDSPETGLRAEVIRPASGGAVLTFRRRGGEQPTDKSSGGDISRRLDEH